MKANAGTHIHDSLSAERASFRKVACFEKEMLGHEVEKTVWAQIAGGGF